MGIGVIVRIVGRCHGIIMLIMMTIIAVCSIGFTVIELQHICALGIPLKDAIQLVYTIFLCLIKVILL